MSKSNENVDDVKFILEEVVRFAKMSKKESLTHLRQNKVDWLCTLPNPFRPGSIICGNKAYERFSAIAERYLKSRDKTGSIDPAEFIKALHGQFAQRFLVQEKGISEATVSRMLSIAYRWVVGKFDTLTHYIPCSITPSIDPDEFAVGPVTFYHRTRFNEKYGSEIEQHRNPSLSDRTEKSENRGIDEVCSADKGERRNTTSIRNLYVDRLQEFFGSFDWIASISVGYCNDKISRKRAVVAVEGAINILRLFLGENYADRIKTAYAPGCPTETATLARSETNNKLNITISMTGEGNILGDNWYQLLRKYNEDFLGPAETTLEAITNPERPMPLCQRFLDAVSWHGEAVVEQSPAAKIVKYVAAIERMVLTGKEFDTEGNQRDVMAIIFNRATTLCHQVFGESLEYWRARLNRVYRCRSDLLHGSISPFDSSVFRLTGEAEFLSKNVILAGLMFFQHLGLGNHAYSEKSLRSKYLELEGICDTASE